MSDIEDEMPLNAHQEIEKRWYDLFPEWNNDGPVEELKPNELKELQTKAKSSFEEECKKQVKNNPADAKWLLTAMKSGTSRDKANSGALLVQTNPIPNLHSLEMLIGETKLANQKSPEVIRILSELLINALLPATRKLFTLELRGADWKRLQKAEKLDKKTTHKILAYWWFESELKDHFFTFLKNVQISSQSGKDNVKCCAIVIVAKLLMYSPEKEQMLLSMLVNKLGDPVGQVAGKAMYHLLEVAYKHPNMCGVITVETEKLLFRTNISEKAQQFALSFLGQISSRADTAVCTKLVEICFSFFKVLIERGDVNNKMMQAILRCLRQAITEAKINEDGTVIPKDTMDTIYRVVHIADINISLQALSLLLQIITIKSGKYDRYYNALYMKLLDSNIPDLGHNSSSLFFYVIHRSIHIDSNVSRCQAMLKRILQAALYFSPAKICATLIVIDKLLKSRPELRNLNRRQMVSEVDEKIKTDLKNHTKYKEIADDDDDEEEKYEDADAENKPDITKTSNASWVHSKVKSSDEKAQKRKSTVFDNEKGAPTRYDMNVRNPMYAGAEFALNAEFLKFINHFHPSVQMFATSLLDSKPIGYKGDPLRDFSLPKFLDRFSFRNPKTQSKVDQTFIHRVFKTDKGYTPHSSRNIPVKALSAENCTEDQRFIFEFLDAKRAVAKVKREDDEESIASVDDDEFDAYLDGLGADKELEDDDFMDEITTEMTKKSKKKSKGGDGAADGDDDEDDEVDYFESDGEEGEDGDSDEDNDGEKKSSKKPKKKKATEEESDDDMLFDSDDDGSISMDGDDDDDAEAMTFSDDEDIDDDSDNDDEVDDDDDEDDDDEPGAKKSKHQAVSAKEFNRKMKHSTDMRSLFASADEFAELLEETGKAGKKHGTLNEVYNKEKASEKQLAWEGERRNTFEKRKKGNKPRPSQGSRKRNKVSAPSASNQKASKKRKR